MDRNWESAGNAFCKVAQLHVKASSKHEAASNYVDAATCFKKCNPDGERKCFVNHIMFQNIFI